MLALQNPVSKNRERKLADKRWEDAFKLADSCLSLYDEGMTITDIAVVMQKNLLDVEQALKLAKAFPPDKRWKNVPIDVYQMASKYPDPQAMVEKAWDNNWHANDLSKDIKKFRGDVFPVPVPARAEKQTPIEVALGVDEEGMTTAKQLYAFLELDLSNYSKWVRKNIEENMFAELGIDYEVFVPEYENPFGGRPRRDYKLTARFAKKLAMASQTLKGEMAREYFIRVEQNAKDFANGKLDCIAPQNGAMRPQEAAKLILETANQFKSYLSKTTLDKMLKTSLELQGAKQIN